LQSHSPVSQRPQSHVAQQQATQSGGQLPPQQSAEAEDVGARNARNNSARKYMMGNSKWMMRITRI
jgi:hypothetical protein